MHQNAGPFVVTLFSIPDDLVTGPADLSVGVEDTTTGEVVNDAVVTLTLTSLDTPSTNRIVTTVTDGPGSRGILKSAEVTLPSAGRWHIAIVVADGAKHGACSMDLIVGTAHNKTYEVWAAAICPLLFMLLFTVRERRKRRWKEERTARVRNT
jgi:hypothetical protein